jgi:methylmalonyl-CoA mutase
VLRISDEFPPVPTAEWEAAIQADLAGANYEKKLVWQTDEGIAVRPYYRSEDIDGLPRDPLIRAAGPGWEMLDSETEMPADAIRADLFHEAGATAVQELGYALAAGVEMLAALTDEGKTVDTAAQSMSFVFAVGSNYFFEIAKLRAARLVWAQAVSAFEPAHASAGRTKIHARTALSNKSIYDRYTNLLRVTTEALSAVIGGCDTLTVVPFGFSDELALNVQRILVEESHLDRAADPGGGSYYIEALTDALAREGWNLFQQVETEGGYAKALSSGSISKAIAASRAAKEKALTFRRRVLVGVNNYPNLTEESPPDFTAPDGVEDLPSWRAPEIFEQIRRRTERHAAAAGRVPKVLLLERGDVKIRRARANFCRNFFGCAGFHMVESTDHENTEADLIILCSSDAEYLPFAQEVCPQVRAPVMVAGHPREQMEMLKSAGVAGFVHASSNMVDTLHEWQDRLGMKE